MELMIERLQALRSTGIAIAIDDFGTGFSSLSYLDQLPADRVKIDRAFVHALDSGSGRRIADMIVPLGHKIGLKVLAEGVETEAQAAILKELGCDEVQGYLYGRPMPLDQLLAWLRGQPGA
jgi:EAL domain-containing protein (putative c-di-GMP-specific phosphodiesterase class I)